MPLTFYSRILGDFVEPVLISSNENKISDGWPAAAGKLCGAWLRVEGGISWKMRKEACQPFAASHG